MAHETGRTIAWTAIMACIALSASLPLARWMAQGGSTRLVAVLDAAGVSVARTSIGLRPVIDPEATGSITRSPSPAPSWPGSDAGRP